MKVFTSASQKTGKLGEDIAVIFLKKNGFVIIERNYTKKWGEIDIVAKKGGVTHFIEVKSVSRENLDENMIGSGFRPEDQMHFWKSQRLMKIIETYMMSHRVEQWNFDLLCVFLNEKQKKAKVKPIFNLILGQN